MNFKNFFSFFFFGKSKKNISSNRPFRIISNGNKSILFAVAITKTGFVFSDNQLIKVANTRLLVPLSPLLSVLLKALSISSIHKNTR
jgi:uncharacterized membrane protein